MSILIVEDNLVNLKILELNLRKHRYKTVTAQNGRQAMECLKSDSEICLVISDIMMPEMDGLTLIEEMRKDNALKEIPVILCTALKDLNTVQKAVDFGCRHYLVKPVNAGQLQQKVREVLGHDRPILQNKRHIMTRLKLDNRTYEEIAKSFAMAIKEKMALIEMNEKKGRVQDISAQLLKLYESANLLGATRVKHILERMANHRVSGAMDEVNCESIALLAELRLLLEALPDVNDGEAALSMERANRRNGIGANYSNNGMPTNIERKRMTMTNQESK